MTRGFHTALSLDLFLFCFLTIVRSEKVLPPENLRLDWTNGPELSWTSPKHSAKNCWNRLNSTVKRANDESSEIFFLASSPWRKFRPMNGGFLRVSVQTNCNGVWSTPVSITNNDPKVDVDCLIISSTWTRCSWTLGPHTPLDLSFFYSLEDVDADESNGLPLFQECPSYTYSNKVTTGCDLRVDPNQSVNILLNGTLNHSTIRNVYAFKSLKLRLAPLNWTVEKVAKDKFHIYWTPPEFTNLDWKYIINYSHCGKPMTLPEIEVQKTSTVLHREPNCPYRIYLKAVVEERGETEWTEHKYFAADVGMNQVLFVVILVPLLLAGLAVLTLFCCMKNKEKIFPKVVQPRDLISDILDNNNKISISDHYFLKVEEVCHVTLVQDSERNKTQV